MRFKVSVPLESVVVNIFFSSIIITLAMITMIKASMADTTETIDG